MSVSPTMSYFSKPKTGESFEEGQINTEDDSATERSPSANQVIFEFIKHVFFAQVYECYIWDNVKHSLYPTPFYVLVLLNGSVGKIKKYGGHNRIVWLG